MSDRVYIFDTTLRDGEQSPGCSMTVPEKLKMARKLVERISKLGTSRQVEVKRAVGYALGWEELIAASGPVR